MNAQAIPALPARRSRTVLRAMHFAGDCGWMKADSGALVAAQIWVDRIEAAQAKTPREAALAIRNFDSMRDEQAYPVTARQLKTGAAHLAILAAYAEGGPEAVKALGA